MVYTTEPMTILMDSYGESTGTNGIDILEKQLSSTVESGLNSSLTLNNNFINESDFGQHYNQSNNLSAIVLNPELIPDLINITDATPIAYAMIMYGYIMPFLLVLTLVANTMIVLVLTQKHMRTPTNLVLMSMAVADMLTLVFPSPWYFYMYTLGYHSQVLHPPPACYAYNSMTDILPIAFHTASIWLTILLAGQRYVYICHPTTAKSWCTRPRVWRTTVVLFLTAFVTQLTRFFDSKYQSIEFEWNGRTEWGCRRVIADWVHNIIKPNIYYPLYYGFRIFFVQIAPCLALVVLNLLLFRALKNAQRKRKILFKDKKTSESKKMRDSNSTTYMLIVIVTLFLMVEIPMAVATLIHILANMSIIPFANEWYKYLKITILISNFIIMLSFPLNFAIYCGMSHKFRITFNELFVKKLRFNRQLPDSNHYTHVSMSTSL